VALNTKFERTIYILYILRSVNIYGRTRGSLLRSVLSTVYLAAQQRSNSTCNEWTSWNKEYVTGGKAFEKRACTALVVKQDHISHSVPADCSTCG